MPFRLCQLIKEIDITGGDDAAVGYYAGMIVSVKITTCESNCSSSRIGISIFLHAGTDSAEVESVV
jgi:hypothetical protein